MMRLISVSAATATVAGILSIGVGIAPLRAAQNEPAPDPKGKTCHMEQQCHWENFKKICTYVKVCR